VEGDITGFTVQFIQRFVTEQESDDVAVSIHPQVHWGGTIEGNADDMRMRGHVRGYRVGEWQARKVSGVCPVTGAIALHELLGKETSRPAQRLQLQPADRATAGILSSGDGRMSESTEKLQSKSYWRIETHAQQKIAWDFCSGRDKGLLQVSIARAINVPKQVSGINVEEVFCRVLIDNGQTAISKTSPSASANDVDISTWEWGNGAAVMSFSARQPLKHARVELTGRGRIQQQWRPPQMAEFQIGRGDIKIEPTMLAKDFAREDAKLELEGEDGILIELTLEWSVVGNSVELSVFHCPDSSRICREVVPARRRMRHSNEWICPVAGSLIFVADDEFWHPNDLEDEEPEEDGADEPRSLPLSLSSITATTRQLQQEMAEYFCDGCVEIGGAAARNPLIFEERFHKRGQEYDLCRACYASLDPSVRSQYQRFECGPILDDDRSTSSDSMVLRQYRERLSGLWYAESCDSDGRSDGQSDEFFVLRTSRSRLVGTDVEGARDSTDEAFTFSEQTLQRGQMSLIQRYPNGEETIWSANFSRPDCSKLTDGIWTVDGSFEGNFRAFHIPVDSQLTKEIYLKLHMEQPQSAQALERLAAHIRQAGLEMDDTSISAVQPEALERARRAHQQYLDGVGATSSVEHVESEQILRDLSARGSVSLPPTPGMLAEAEARALRTLSESTPTAGSRSGRSPGARLIDNLSLLSAATPDVRGRHFEDADLGSTSSDDDDSAHDTCVVSIRNNTNERLLLCFDNLQLYMRRHLVRGAGQRVVLKPGRQHKVKLPSGHALSAFNESDGSTTHIWQVLVRESAEFHVQYPIPEDQQPRACPSIQRMLQSIVEQEHRLETVRSLSRLLNPTTEELRLDRLYKLEACLAFGTHGGFAIMLPLLYCERPQVAAATATLLADACVMCSNRQKIRDANILPRLVAMIHSTSEQEAQVQAVCALDKAMRPIIKGVDPEGSTTNAQLVSRLLLEAGNDGEPVLMLAVLLKIASNSPIAAAVRTLLRRAEVQSENLDRLVCEGWKRRARSMWRRGWRPLSGTLTDRTVERRRLRVYCPRWGEGQLCSHDNARECVINFDLAGRQTVHAAKDGELWVAPATDPERLSGVAAVVTNNLCLASVDDVHAWLCKQGNRVCELYADQMRCLGLTGQDLVDMTRPEGDADERLQRQYFVSFPAHREILLRHCTALEGFLSRYALQDGPPLHRSQQCCVIRALDRFCGVNLALGGRSRRGSHRQVVLKCFHSEQAFEREVMARTRTAGCSVAVPLIRVHVPPPPHYSWPIDLECPPQLTAASLTPALVKDSSTFDERLTGSLVLVMECAEYITGNVLRSEAGATLDLHRAQTELHALASLLGACEEAGVIHGDVCWDNVGMYGGHMKLLDFDHGAAVGENCRFSQRDGNCPPELASWLAGGMESGERNDQGAFKADLETSDHRLHQPSFHLPVTSLMDIWGFGVALLSRLTLHTKASEDEESIGWTDLSLSNAKHEARWSFAGLRRFALGWETQKLSAVAQIDDPSARDLALWCLQGVPKRRAPSFRAVLQHPFLNADATESNLRCYPSSSVVQKQLYDGVEQLHVTSDRSLRWPLLSHRLHSAVEHCSVEAVAELFDLGGVHATMALDDDHDSVSPLHRSLQQRLLWAGIAPANPMRRTSTTSLEQQESFATATREEWDMLHNRAYKSPSAYEREFSQESSVDIVRYLVAELRRLLPDGVGIEQTPGWVAANGYTPLHLACLADHAQSLELLLGLLPSERPKAASLVHQVDTSLLTDYGETAADIACACGAWQCLAVFHRYKDVLRTQARDTDADGHDSSLDLRDTVVQRNHSSGSTALKGFGSCEIAFRSLVFFGLHYTYQTFDNWRCRLGFALTGDELFTVTDVHPPPRVGNRIIPCVAVQSTAPTVAGVKQVSTVAEELSDIDHPHLATIVGFTIGDGPSCPNTAPRERAYLVYEAGKTDLAALLADGGPLAANIVCKIGAQIARGLCALHEAGFVHLRLQPECVMFVFDASEASAAAARDRVPDSTPPRCFALLTAEQQQQLQRALLPASTRHEDGFDGFAATRAREAARRVSPQLQDAHLDEILRWQREQHQELSDLPQLAPGWRATVAGYGSVMGIPQQASRDRVNVGAMVGVCSGRYRAPEWHHIARREKLQREHDSCRDQIADKKDKQEQLREKKKDATKSHGKFATGMSWEAGRTAQEEGQNWDAGKRKMEECAFVPANLHDTHARPELTHGGCWYTGTTRSIGACRRSWTSCRPWSPFNNSNLNV
jgi:hypothetical protein